MPIKDQRNLYATMMALDTPQDVERYWQLVAANESGMGFERDGVRTRQLVETGETVMAFIDHGRWVAQCVCSAGMACWIANPKTACLACGRIYAVDFPSLGEAQEAEAVLEARPTVHNQNWKRHEDESVLDLKVENVSRGYPIKGRRKLAEDVAVVHGVSEEKAHELLREIAGTGNTLLLPEEI